MSTTKIKGGNLTGAYLARYALEQLPVKHVFGIPGVHNTELYDEINKSEKIEPILVTHEGGGAFMADGISRTSDEIGTLLIVPAAGTTHAMSGIGEGFQGANDSGSSTGLLIELAALLRAAALGI